ncbi:MAG: response regulator transcription factor [Bacteroidetes Order II. Incertae sedis bacterium]|nr:response regulator transcription factor [Bacteroidetes Order II. bacterium]
MPTLRCLAVDDEPLALDLLEDNIRQVPFLELVACCRTIPDALQWLNDSSIDLIFLDIQLPGITGVQFLRSLRPQQKVIFVTAYSHYALEGYELNVVDYLLKPVPFQRFLQAAQKALDTMTPSEVVISTTPPPLPKALHPPIHQDTIWVNADYALIPIRLADVLYVESEKDYLRFHLASQQRPLITRMTLKSLEEKLPSPPFCRVHKSFIVATRHITAIRNQRLMIGETWIPISEMYQPDLLAAIGQKPIN